MSERELELLEMARKLVRAWDVFNSNPVPGQEDPVIRLRAILARYKAESQ